MKVLTFGTFDLLHPGHRFILESAAERGDLTVVVARDHNVLRIKGRSPVDSEDVRIANVQSVVRGATVILGGDGTDFLEPVRAVGPDLIVLGYDQKLPPGVSDSDFDCPVERLEALEPETYKSSKIRGNS